MASTASGTFDVTMRPGATELDGAVARFELTKTFAGDLTGSGAGVMLSAGNPGVGANWSIYPDTGWVGVILGNRDADDVSLQDMIEQETQAVTGTAPTGGAGG